MQIPASYNNNNLTLNALTLPYSNRILNAKEQTLSYAPTPMTKNSYMPRNVYDDNGDAVDSDDDADDDDEDDAGPCHIPINAKCFPLEPQCPFQGTCLAEKPKRNQNEPKAVKEHKDMS